LLVGMLEVDVPYLEIGKSLSPILLRR